jgi:uncharacterized protein YlxW (UPF0749 family)
MRNLVLAVIVVTVLALVGCGGDENKAKKELAAARAQISRESASARDAIKRDKDAAQRELSDLARQVGDERQALADMKKKVNRESGKLDRLRGQVSGARRAIAKNTFPGEGTFVVGSDISPGTYRASAQSGCYWARLSSLNTSDIIDNNNSDGPVAVQILASDKAFQAQGCSDFTKAGP